MVAVGAGRERPRLHYNWEAPLWVIRLCQLVRVQHCGRIGCAAIGELGDVERTVDRLAARCLPISYEAERRGENQAQG